MPSHLAHIARQHAACSQCCAQVNAANVYCNSLVPAKAVKLGLQTEAAHAGFYGIRPTYTVLAHLRWAIKPENATVTAMCLEILGNELKPLKQAEVDGDLLPQVCACPTFTNPSCFTIAMSVMPRMSYCMLCNPALVTAQTWETCIPSALQSASSTARLALSALLFPTPASICLQAVAVHLSVITRIENLTAAAQSVLERIVSHHFCLTFNQCLHCSCSFSFV